MQKIVLLLLSFLICSCIGRTSANKSTAVVEDPASLETSLEEGRENEYAGTYYLNTGDVCKLTVSISGNRYSLKTISRKKMGSLEIVPEMSATYLLFKGLQGDDSEEEIRGLYKAGTITIQNYGNTLNPYTLLNECSGKYLQLERSER